MSLILDALRKLEREKDAREPGVLVVGSVPWGERSRASRVLLVAGAAGVLALAVAAGWMLRPVRVAPSPAAPVAAPATVPPRPAPTLPPPAPTLPAISVSPTEPPPPPIRISRPPAQRLPVAPAASGATAPPAAAQVGPATVPAAPSEPATPAPATETGAIGIHPPVAAPASPPTAVELSSAPVPPATQAAPSTPPAPGGLRLNAISQRDGRPVALINDRLVFEGDSFDGVKVLRIGDTEVEVEVRGEKRVLRF